MWYDEAVVYQIYPLGLCGAPLQNDGDQSQADNHRILRVLDWVEHIKALGADTVLLNPVCESDRHGYDTRDYFRVDPRLGSNEDLAQVCRAFHRAGLRVGETLTHINGHQIVDVLDYKFFSYDTRLELVLREEDGETVMSIIQGRCPMWQADGLCRIQAELGEAALCQTSFLSAELLRL